MAYYKAESADVVGDVTIGEDVGIWYHVTIRGDVAKIVIGDGTNVQDNSVIHSGIGYPVTIGKDVTIGHGAIVHGCTVEDDCLIGMGAIVMNGALVGRGAVIAAGALVPQGMVIPEGMLAIGSPARVTRRIGEEEAERNRVNTKNYRTLALSLPRIDQRDK